jgi:DNA-binding GntR family transcriptional regulator
MIPLRGKSSLAEHESLFDALKGNSVEAVELAFRSHMANLQADIERYWDMVKP